MNPRRYIFIWDESAMMQDKKQRFEFKYWIGWREYNILQPRLASLLSRDPHTDSNGEYKIRSLYFDSWNRMCVHEKLSGIETRKKYRARVYGEPGIPSSKIKMEIKYRSKNRIAKRSVPLSVEQYREVFSSSPRTFPEDTEIARELQSDFARFNLQPITIVQYTREPYIYSSSNVRITFDKYLSSSGSCVDLFEPNAPSIPVHTHNKLILEVKYDNFLPTLVKTILANVVFERSAISKYVWCYGSALDERVIGGKRNYFYPNN
jgi:hypothetical protein